MELTNEQMQKIEQDMLKNRSKMAAHTKKLRSIFPQTGGVSEPGFSYDQKIGMLRKLFIGNDPHQKEREKVADELERLINSSVQYPLRDKMDKEIDYLIQTGLYLRPEELRQPSAEAVKRGMESGYYENSDIAQAMKEFTDQLNDGNKKVRKNGTD